MSKPVRVYNKGTRPIVWKRNRTGTETIHPNKFDIFSAEKAEEIIKKFDNACSESEFKKVVAEREKKAAAAAKQSEKDSKAEIKESLK